MWKTEHFDANFIEIGYLLLKIVRFYVFKMAANGGCILKLSLKFKIMKLNLFLKNMHTHTLFTTTCTIFAYYVNNQFMRIF